MDKKSPMEQSNNMLDKLIWNNHDFLADANTSYRDFLEHKDHTWVVDGVRLENIGWKNHVDPGHVLDTYTRGSFNVSQSISITSPIDGSTATVDYRVTENTFTCGKHPKASINTILTGSSGSWVYVCSVLSSTDFSNLVWAIAVPKLTIFTNEKCLGLCSAHLPSFSIQKHKVTPWLL